MMRCPTCYRPFLRGGPGISKLPLSPLHEVCAGCGVVTAKNMLYNGYCRESCAITINKRRDNENSTLTCTRVKLRQLG